MRSEMVRALTPWFLSGMSFLIVLLGVVSPGLTPELRLSVLNLASVALGGAAGLSQQNKSNAQIQNSEIQSLNVKPDDEVYKAPR